MGPETCKPIADSARVYKRSLVPTYVYGHTTLKIPVLVRSPKSSNVGRG